MTTRFAVIGAGITGAAAAFELSRSPAVADGSIEVVVFDGAPGGRLRSTPFAGIDSVDEGADAFLQRVPDAVELAAEVGLGDDLVHPEPVGAAVWHDRLHPIPDGLVLGVPSDLVALARGRLLSARGIARSALEPLLPRRPVPGFPDDGRARDADSIGRLVRARFGREVHDRVVDALVGSIYATDTDRFSLAEVPQLAALADHRSLLLGARRARTTRGAATGAGTATAASAPIFGAPHAGMSRLVVATLDAATGAGIELRTSVARLEAVEPGRAGGVIVDGDRFDGVLLAVPAAAAAGLLGELHTTHAESGAVATLAAADTADVVMVTLHIGPDEWPDRLDGLSGYLVPKSVQRHVTAASFGSRKWAHWRPPDGGEILRVSAGRDGAPVLDLDDDALVDRALDDLHRHLGVAFSPKEIRVTRWPGAFAQYRPHHRRWVERVRGALPDRVRAAGSSFDGIGVPACIRSGRTVAAQLLNDVVVEG